MAAKHKYETIILPTRPQVDTIISIFVLKKFGAEIFPGIENATYESLPQVPADLTEESAAEEGKILIDIGGGKFDHHNKEKQTTALNLVCDYLGQKDNPALARLKQFVERDDFYGKGIVSTDQLDRAFGLPGLISCLNKKYAGKPAVVIDTILPIIEAYYEEEERRAVSMPKEVAEKLESGKAVTFAFEQNGRKFKAIFIESDNTSIAGFLRSRLGGEYDAVAMALSSGHINVLTLQRRNIDLRSLTVLVRLQEAEAAGKNLDADPETLSVTGKLKEVPNWHYDPATNSLLNGGPNPQGTTPTAISIFEFLKILEAGLSQKLWTPTGPNPHLNNQISRKGLTT